MKIIGIDFGTTNSAICFYDGLKSDSTVVAVGFNENGECNTESWRGIGPFFPKNLCKFCGEELRGLIIKKCKSCGSIK